MRFNKKNPCFTANFNLFEEKSRKKISTDNLSNSLLKADSLEGQKTL